MSKISNNELHDIILGKMHKIYSFKNKRYGNSFSKTFDEFGPLSLCVRLSDKLERITTLIKTGCDSGDESLKDSLMDLANYAVMGIMELEKQEEQEEELHHKEIEEIEEIEENVDEEIEEMSDEERDDYFDFALSRVRDVAKKKGLKVKVEENSLQNYDADDILKYALSNDNIGHVSSTNYDNDMENLDNYERVLTKILKSHPSLANNNTVGTLEHIINTQSKFQQKIQKSSILSDNPKLMHYHLSAATVEIAEILQKDERWKDWKKHPREFNRKEKLEEFADVFIFLINGLLFSGFGGKEFCDIIYSKINKNYKRQEEGY